MSFDVASAKTRLGLPSGDTTRDAIITGALNAALAIAENYCDRKFLFKHEVATFTHHNGGRLQLKRYPLQKVDSVTYGHTTGQGAVTAQPLDRDKWHVHYDYGYLEKHNGGGNHHDIIEVAYSGGYKLLPADLELALWGIFDNVYASMTPASAGGGVSAANMGGISSISLPDIGTISFGQGGATATAKTNFGNAMGLSNYSVYGPYFALLSIYKDLSA